MTVYRFGPSSDTPVRLVGITSHRVRGRGVHEHREYLTANGSSVLVTHWPAQPSTRTVVTWWSDDNRREVTEPGSVEWALTRAGFEIAAPATTTPARAPWPGPRPPVT